VTKKAIPVLLILLMLLSACGLRVPRNSGQGSAEGMDGADMAMEQMADEEGTGRSTSDPSIPELAVSESYYWQADRTTGENICRGTLGTVALGHVTDYETVAQSEELAKLRKKMDATAEELEERYVEEFSEMLKEASAEGEFVLTVEPAVLRADDALVCVEYDRERRGPDGTTESSCWGINYDTRKGKILKIGEVLTRKGNRQFANAFRIAFSKQYPEASATGNGTTLSGEILDRMDDGEDFSFLMDASALTVVISPGALTEAVDGPMYIRMPYASYPEMFNEKYTDPGEDYIVGIRADGSDYNGNADGWTVTGKDGVQRSLDLAGEDGTITVSFGGQNWSAENAEDAQAYLFHVMDHDYLYLSCEDEQTGHRLYVLDLSQGVPILLQELSSGFGDNIPTDPYGFYLTRRSDFLSTCTVYAAFSASEQGAVQQDRFWRIYDTAPVWMLLQDLNMTVTAESDSGSGQVETVAAGTEFTLSRTDGSTYMDLEGPDGRLYRVYYSNTSPDTGEAGDYLNGLPADDVFSGRMYAGKTAA